MYPSRVCYLEKQARPRFPCYKSTGSIVVAAPLLDFPLHSVLILTHRASEPRPGGSRDRNHRPNIQSFDRSSNVRSTSLTVVVEGLAGRLHPKSSTNDPTPTQDRAPTDAIETAEMQKLRKEMVTRLGLAESALHNSYPARFAIELEQFRCFHRRHGICKRSGLTTIF